MDKIQSNVREFMLAAGQQVRSKPTSPSQGELALRVTLLLEEVLELAEASGVSVMDFEGNEMTMDAIIVQAGGEFDESRLCDVADAIADISYVNYGAALTFGIDMEPIEQFVQNANMAKFGEGGYRRDDGKWMKPPDWTGPEENIKQEIARQQNA